MSHCSELLGNILREKKLSIATAESCTAGGISAEIASVDGASNYLVGGAIVYATRLKNELLGVSTDTILRHGVVSRQTAMEMNEGVRRLTGADVAISVTGYIGASGGDTFAGNGTVWICVGRNGHDCQSLCLTVNSTRRENSREVIEAAINFAINILQQPDSDDKT